MIRATVKADRCSKCKQYVFYVQRYSGSWMAIDTTLIDKGPRYALHTRPDGSAIAIRENIVNGYKNHVCPKAKTPIGGHTPQLF